MYYVYVIKSIRDKKLYIGYTSDLRKRLIQHNNGDSKSTKSRAPFRLVYYEAYLSKNSAKDREFKLKYFGKAYSQLKNRIGLDGL